MKKLLTKPGFEFIFSVSLIAIFVLPLLVFAQGTKDVEIQITNGDTVINGKHINELSPPERKQALKDIGNLDALAPKSKSHQRMMMKQHFLADSGSNRQMIIDGGMDHDMAQQFRFQKDSSFRAFKFHMRRPGGKDSTFAFDPRMDGGPEGRFDERDFNFPHRGPRMEFMRHRNTQSFDYTNTGSDGISTHVSFRVTDPSPEKLKELANTAKAELEIKDLNLVPEFSSGKVTLMFGLPARSIAEVKFTDHDGKLIWSDKAVNGSFNKSFALGLNGIYYLQIEQAGKKALKRIIKEE